MKTFFCLLFLTFFPFVSVFGESFSGSDQCSACHQNEYDQWKNSIHAKALSSSFQKIWGQLGKKPECLECHTTGHKKGTPNYAFPGVTCESCHGAYKQNHPGEAKMILPVDSEICASCHSQTHKEWKISPHGQKNIRCFDCHQVHAQGLRVKGEEALCGSCHSGRLKSFAHTSHHLKGLTCMTCHFPSQKKSSEAIEGTGASSHNLSVGAEICSRCHKEMVHESHRLVSLRGEVTALQGVIKESQAEDVHKLKDEIEKLEWQLKKYRWMIPLVIFISTLIGLVAGIAVTYRRLKKNGD